MKSKFILFFTCLSLVLPSIAAARGVSLFNNAKNLKASKGKITYRNFSMSVKEKAVSSIYYRIIDNIESYLCENSGCHIQAINYINSCGLLDNELKNRGVETGNLQKDLNRLSAQLEDETSEILAKKIAWFCVAEKSYLKSLGLLDMEEMMSLAEIKALAMEMMMHGTAGMMGNTPVPEFGWSYCGNVGGSASIFGSCGITGSNSGSGPTVAGGGQRGSGREGSDDGRGPFGNLDPKCLDNDPRALFGNKAEDSDTDTDTDDDKKDDDKKKTGPEVATEPPSEEEHQPQQQQQPIPQPQGQPSGGTATSGAGAGESGGSDAGTELAKMITSKIANAIGKNLAIARPVTNFIIQNDIYLKPGSAPTVEGRNGKGVLISLGGTFMPNPEGGGSGINGCRNALYRSFRDCIFGNEGSGRSSPGFGSPDTFQYNDNQFNSLGEEGFYGRQKVAGEAECQISTEPIDPPRGDLQDSGVREGRGVPIDNGRPDNSSFTPPQCHCRSRSISPLAGQRENSGGCCPAHCFAARFGNGGNACTGCSMSPACNEMDGGGEKPLDINELCSGNGSYGSGSPLPLDDICNDINPVRLDVDSIRGTLENIRINQGDHRINIINNRTLPDVNTNTTPPVEDSFQEGELPDDTTRD